MRKNFATANIDLVEFYLSRAELQYANGLVRESIQSAETALSLRPNPERTVALKLFIARALSSLSEFDHSNKICRELITENVYLPPIILGILHNNLQLSRIEKSERNLGLIKLFV